MQFLCIRWAGASKRIQYFFVSTVFEINRKSGSGPDRKHISLTFLKCFHYMVIFLSQFFENVRKNDEKTLLRTRELLNFSHDGCFGHDGQYKGAHAAFYILRAFSCRVVVWLLVFCSSPLKQEAL